MRKYCPGYIIPHHYDRWEYTVNRDDSICLRAFHGDRDVLCIPNSLMGRPVTTLGRCFHGSAGTHLVIIPSTVTSIGAHALSMEESLQAVLIPPEVTFIHPTAFRDMLEEEDFRLFVTEGSCAHAFAQEHGFRYELDVFPELEEDEESCCCGDWHYAVLSDDRCVIREYNGMDSVVRVPGVLDGHEVIGLNGSCFHGNLFMEELIVPEGVEYLGNFALAHCPSLRRVELPDSMTSVGGACFAHCRDLSEVRLPAGLGIIMLMAFIDCVSLRSITLPRQVHSILPMAFHGCRSLEEVHLSPVLESVTDSSFDKCPRLRRPVLPDTLNEESRALLSRLPA